MWCFCFVSDSSYLAYFQDLSMPYHVPALHSFLLLDSTLLYGYITFIYPFIIWVVSTFGYCEYAAMNICELVFMWMYVSISLVK